jgi:hypothetical protein
MALFGSLSGHTSQEDTVESRASQHMVNALSPSESSCTCICLSSARSTACADAQKRDPCRGYAVISRDAVDVDRLADRLAMWIDDEGLYNAQANPRPQRLRSNPVATSLGSKRARRPRSGACWRCNQ